MKFAGAWPVASGRGQVNHTSTESVRAVSSGAHKRTFERTSDRTIERTSERTCSRTSKRTYKNCIMSDGYLATCAHFNANLLTISLRQRNIVAFVNFFANVILSVNKFTNRRINGNVLVAAASIVGQSQPNFEPRHVLAEHTRRIYTHTHAKTHKLMATKPSSDG